MEVYRIERSGQLLTRTEMVHGIQIEVVNQSPSLLPRLVELFPEEHVDLLVVTGIYAMCSGKLHSDHIEVRPPSAMKDLILYSKRVCSPQDWLCAADYAGKIRTLTVCYPYEGKLHAYKEKQGLNLKTRTLRSYYAECTGGNYVKWQYPWMDPYKFPPLWYSDVTARTISPQRLARGLKKSPHPFVVAVDLNGFHFLRQQMRKERNKTYAEDLCRFLTNARREQEAYFTGQSTYASYPSDFELEDQKKPEDYMSVAEKCTEQDYEQRLATLKAILVQAKKEPAMVSISRSQVPLASVPLDKVDDLEGRVIEALERVFK
ncbi:hypothetical protein HYW21_06815 [Candidatus Woesearchaeota archaeon]|nr:hypothetical protein [Candidatus Woesearchaeota archaeon]